MKSLSTSNVIFIITMSVKSPSMWTDTLTRKMSYTPILLKLSIKKIRVALMFVGFSMIDSCCFYF